MAPLQGDKAVIYWALQLGILISLASPGHLLANDSSTRDANATVVEASIIPLSAGGTIIADPRGSLRQHGPAVGLSPAQIENIFHSTGKIFCLEEGRNLGDQASAQLFIDNGQILTAAHVVFDKNGQPRGQCVFRTWASNALFPLNFVSMTYGSRFPDQGGQASLDWAVIRLERPVVDGVAFQPADLPPERPLDLSATTMVAVLDAWPEGWWRGPQDEPIVEDCTPGRRYLEDRSRPGSFALWGDCTEGSGSSGGAELVQDGKGKNAIWSILTKGGSAAVDGRPFEMFPSGDPPGSYSVGIGPYAIERAMALSKSEPEGPRGAVLAGAALTNGALVWRRKV